MSCKQPLFLEDGKLSGANSHAVTLEGHRRPSFVLITSGGPGTLGTRQMEEGGVEGEVGPGRGKGWTLGWVKATSSKLDFGVSDRILSGI